MNWPRIYTIKFYHPLLLRPLFHDAHNPSEAYILYGCPPKLIPHLCWSGYLRLLSPQPSACLFIACPPARLCLLLSPPPYTKFHMALSLPISHPHSKVQELFSNDISRSFSAAAADINWAHRIYYRCRTRWRQEIQMDEIEFSTL